MIGSIDVRAPKRVLLVGLDCAPPRFVFGDDAFDLPNIRSLMRRGAWAPLRSVDPPITIPAWACMMSGKDPGELGCYGFRNRADHGYRELERATGASIAAPRLWDIASRHGLKCLVIGVPQTYPPRPLNGCLVSGLDTPAGAPQYTYPKSLKHDLERATGPYLVDVSDFRTDDKAALLDRIYAVMRNRFAITKYLMDTHAWNLCIAVDIGMDRLHHGFWKYCDPLHPGYVPDNPFQHALRDYYRAVDAEIGDLVDQAGPDAAVFVVSDHGAKAMQGAFRINQWLIDRGYLRIRHTPAPGTPLEHCEVDWPNTKAWAAGGYYARIFINCAGREPHGCVPSSEYDGFCRRLDAELRAVPGKNGRPLNTKVLRPRDVYRRCNGIPPDMLVYIDDLNLRAVGTVGHTTLYTDENDTGPDDANHDYDGIFVMAADSPPRGQLERLSILDVSQIVLSHLGLSALSESYSSS